MAERIGCSAWARSCGASPAGTAPAAPGGVLLVEWPLPWPRDIGDVAELAPVLAAAAPLGARVLLVAGDDQPGDERTLCWYRSPSPDPLTAAVLTPVEARCSRSTVVATALALLGGESPGPAAIPRFDVVVCTHGRRDTCCGSAGTSLYRSLRAAALPGDVRLWRSSHQGGHRFAPTALVLPDGTSWAYLDVATVRSVLRRDVPAAAVVDHYRGCVTLADPQLQALDATALATAGWAWSAATRVGRRLGPNRLELATSRARCEGIVVDGTGYHLPPCGTPSTATDVLRTAHHSSEVMAFRM